MHAARETEVRARRAVAIADERATHATERTAETVAQAVASCAAAVAETRRERDASETRRFPSLLMCQEKDKTKTPLSLFL